MLATPDDVLASLTDAEAADLEAMRANPRAYADLARSIAPGVRGHDDVKRSVLLQLLGGVHKTTADGASLRGDINVAIVGDPSTAKSQILKYVASFLPRAVYTSGRASSAAGLTASVVREADSGEMAIEAGALMLANGAVCCIDEFDKMDPKDQVAIHEAMEQQTISVTKAGVQATLVARTSILAAANPAGGATTGQSRCGTTWPCRRRSCRGSTCCTSWSTAGRGRGCPVAAHIVALHQRPATALAGLAPYSTPQVQRYVRLARAYRPVLPPAARRAIVEGYRRLRSEDAAPGSAAAYRITVRQLEALVRLSEACARARLSARVGGGDVREALRLLRHSVIEVEPPPEELGGGGGGFGDDDEDGVDDDEAAAAAVAAAAAARREAAGGGRRGRGSRERDGGGRGGRGRRRRSRRRRRRRPHPAPAHQGPPLQGGASQGPPADAPAFARGGSGARRGEERAGERRRRRRGRRRRRRGGDNGGGGGAPDASNPARAAEIGGAPVAAVRQCDLVAWYFDFQAHRGALLDVDLASERALVDRIVSHLIRARGVLVVVEVPALRAGEGPLEYRRRCVRERLLAVNPNFSDE